MIPQCLDGPAATPSRCPTWSFAESSGLCVIQGSETMRAQSNFRFRCYRAPVLRKNPEATVEGNCVANTEGK
jgi:hypothetical protein